MTANTFRCTQDLTLFEKLLKVPEVQKVNQEIERQLKKGIQGTRRQLLSTSVRLSEKMSPTLHALAKDCTARLGIDIPLELYVYSSPQFNAACVKPEDGRLFILFSSSLLDAFKEEELRFVMGHELGHYLYQHHDIPIGYLLRGNMKIPPELALNLTSWSRYAEISADRAGAYCTDDFHTVASALFKLSSGVTSDIITFDLDAFLRQIEDIKTEDAEPNYHSRTEDWFLTHPFSPLRVKALELYHQSCFALNEGGYNPEQLATSVETLMTLMEPSYLDSKTDVAKNMSHLLLAGLLTIANADQEINEAERTVFEDFFGKHKLSTKLNLEKLKEDLPNRAAQVRKTASIPKRMQVLRDLCIMVKANATTFEKGKALLSEIAKQLDISEKFIEQILSDNETLD